MSEESLISAFLGGDKSSVSALYDRYAGPLYGVISRICLEEEVAKDVLQDVFVKIWENRSKYNPDKAKLFTWMYAIARNTALDSQRKSEKNRTVDIQSASSYVSQQGIYTDGIDMDSKLNSLEGKYKDVIYALFFQGYSQREWSKKSGLPLGTIKTRLRIGMRELRKVYKELVIIILIFLNSGT